MAASNLAVLTKSHNIIASKKRAKKEQIKEIVFDDAARRYAHARPVVIAPTLTGTI